MNPALEYNDMMGKIDFWLDHLNKRDSALFVGILFCPVSNAITKSQILPGILDFHYSSGMETQFFFPGYAQVYEEDASSDDIRPETVQALSMHYEAEKFHEFKDKIHSLTKWRFSGGTDLLLLDARYNPAVKKAYLDLSCVIPVTLEFSLTDGKSPTAAMFFERIFQFANQYDGDRPTWDFSDRIGASLLGDAAKNFGVSLLPSAIQGQTKEAMAYAVRDISA